MRTESNKKNDKIKVLNLYAGIGGNRKYWQNVDVTAVEWDEKIADIYQDFYPQDRVIVGDAHQYLRDYYKEFDFIWSSPPCQSHSRLRYCLGVRSGRAEAMYPDFNLYQEIAFLQYHSKANWVVENVIPYYKPLMASTAIVQRHCFWSNKPIAANDNFKRYNIKDAKISELQEAYGFDLSKYRGINKVQVLKNCVAPEVGQYVFGQVMKEAL